MIQGCGAESCALLPFRILFIPIFGGGRRPARCMHNAQQRSAVPNGPKCLLVALCLFSPAVFCRCRRCRHHPNNRYETHRGPPGFHCRYHPQKATLRIGDKAAGGFVEAPENGEPTLSCVLLKFDRPTAVWETLNGELAYEYCCL
ncbi:hypothetical protein L596_018983 [Steinernema carpocapsae]|uniref:Uncharacterized protein n=1 Tax=Steinernema carpocapsae TaxID=34508 RepID=A0A4U5N6R3_STECR|nr:hypothetical protein L596_018983 [Steinernema carpocapsae]